MCFIFSFIPLTIFVTIGFFVLFAAQKIEGGLRRFGRILSVWIFIAALIFPTMGAYLTFSNKCPIETFIKAVAAQDQKYREAP